MGQIDTGMNDRPPRPHCAERVWVEWVHAKYHKMANSFVTQDPNKCAEKHQEWQGIGFLISFFVGFLVDDYVEQNWRTDDSIYV